jgi:N-acetylglucosaminyl-diphospho-decaprenol L-rhamnosyltransferase
VGAVVVNHDAGDALMTCVASLRRQDVGDVVVVDNASRDGSADRLREQDPRARVVSTGRNLGYGAGVNRGLALVDQELVLVCNPDVVVHDGAVAALGQALADHPDAAIAGPCLVEGDGSRYPSARRFPSWVDAAGHAVISVVRPDNPFTRRYKMTGLDTTAVTAVDWVSGACFLARRAALSALGGFDESYFMYLEDTDLCWRAGQAGYRVLYVPRAVVSHVQGLSTARRPYRMLVAHHRSALRFAIRTTTGWRRAGLPVVAVVLGLRLVAVMVRQCLSDRRRVHWGRPKALHGAD